MELKLTKDELDRAMVATVWPVLDPQGAARETLVEYRKAWLDFTLAVQELSDAMRMLVKEQARVKYWVCGQNPQEHVWDFDDPRIAMVEASWRTHGKQRCPKCAGILEQHTAKVSK